MAPTSDPGTHDVVVPRPSLLRRLDGAMGRRLTLLTAPAGYGKTTLLSAWARTVRAAWVRPQREDLVELVEASVAALRGYVPALERGMVMPATQDEPDADPDRARAGAAWLADELARVMHQDVVLLLDDVALPEGAATTRFVADLVRQSPPGLHVVVSGRRAPGFAVARLEQAGDLLRLDGLDLGLDEEETATWLRTLVGEAAGAPDVVGRVHQVAGGWPLAVRRIAHGLATSEDPARAARRLGPGTIGTDELLADALADEPSEVRELLRVLAALPAATPNLCHELGIEAADELPTLARQGLFVEVVPGEEDRYRLRPLARGHLACGDDPSLEGALVAAAGWFERHGHLDEALRCLVAAGDAGAVAVFLGTHGWAMADVGQVPTVLDALESLPAEVRGPGLDELHGTLLHGTGDQDGALARLHAAAAVGPGHAARVEWRIGLIHHLRGEFDEAEAAYERGHAAMESATVEDLGRAVAMLPACWASTRFLRGDRDGAHRLARRALEVASVLADDRALSATHTALAMLAALDGDRAVNDAHYVRALEHAQRAGDVVQVIRIRNNRASHHLEEGAPDLALEELEGCLQLAERSGIGVFRAMALTNRGEANMALGRLPEARADLVTARALWRDLGSRMEAYALRHLGELELLRGDQVAACQHLEAAVEMARPAGDVQAIVPAAAALARALADDDPDTARRWRDVALSEPASLARVAALLAAGHVALANGCLAEAEASALEAEELARRRRDPVGEVEAVRLQALATEDADVRHDRLSRAGDVLARCEDPTVRARVDLTRARWLDPVAARALVEDVQQRMRALGCGQLDQQATAILERLGGTETQLRVETLGGFRVFRDGVVVDARQWQSRRARDLLKVLIARRGRPVPRDELIALLWPGEESDRLGDRLNVTVSTLRGVLDPDRDLDADHVVASGEGSLRIVLEHLEVDVERLLDDEARAERLHRTGRVEEALEHDRRVVATHRGTFLEEHAYDDWAVPLREQARAAYLTSLRRLADAAAGRGDTGTEARLLLRVLELDAYDEPTHLRLVRALARAGRHGEARRAYAQYSAAMDELEIEPAPYPGP